MTETNTIKSKNLLNQKHFPNKNNHKIELPANPFILGLTDDSFGKINLRDSYYMDRKKLLFERELNLGRAMYLVQFYKEKIKGEGDKQILDTLSSFKQTKQVPVLKEQVKKFMQEEIKRIESFMKSEEEDLADERKKLPEYELKNKLLQELQKKTIRINNNTIEVVEDKFSVFLSPIEISEDLLISYRDKDYPGLESKDPKIQKETHKLIDTKTKILEAIFRDFHDNPKQNKESFLKKYLEDKINNLTKSIHEIKKGEVSDQSIYLIEKKNGEKLKKNLHCIETNDWKNIDVQTVEPFLYAALKLSSIKEKIENGTFPEMLNPLIPKNKWGDNISIIACCEQNKNSLRSFSYRKRILGTYLSQTKSMAQAVALAQQKPQKYIERIQGHNDTEVDIPRYQVPISTPIPDDVWVKHESGTKVPPRKVLIILGAPGLYTEKDRKYYSESLEQTIKDLKKQYNLTDEDILVDKEPAKDREKALEEKFKALSKFANENKDTEGMVIYIGHGTTNGYEEGITLSDREKQGAANGVIHLEGEKNKNHRAIEEKTVKEWSRKHLKDFKHCIFLMDTCDSGDWVAKKEPKILPNLPPAPPCS